MISRIAALTFFASAAASSVTTSSYTDVTCKTEASPAENGNAHSMTYTKVAADCVKQVGAGADGKPLWENTVKLLAGDAIEVYKTKDCSGIALEGFKSGGMFVKAILLCKEGRNICGAWGSFFSKTTGDLVMPFGDMSCADAVAGMAKVWSGASMVHAWLTFVCVVFFL